MEAEKTSSVSVNLTKTIIFIILAAVLTGGTFLFENAHGEEAEEIVAEFSEFKDEEENIIPERGVIRFRSQENEEDEEDKTSMNIKLNEDNKYIFELVNGHIWGNFSISNAEINLVIENVVIMPQKATFDLSYDGNQVELAVFGGDVYLGFLPEDIKATSILNAYSDVFMNRILVPNNTQVRFSMRQITPEIKPLLYSKLSKEIRLSSISDTKRESEWVRENIQADLKFTENFRQKFLSEIAHKGISVRGTFWGDIIFRAEEVLTFVPQKKEQVAFNHIFDHLDTAIFHAMKGETEDAQKALATYKSALTEEIKKSTQYEEIVNRYLENLEMFPPGSPLHEIWIKLMEEKFLTEKNKHEIVNIFWLDIYRAITVSEEAATTSFEIYHRHFENFIKTQTEEEFLIRYLTYQNQLMEGLLLRTPIFYKEKYLEIKKDFEKKLMELYPEGRLKDELRQQFISNKIDLMRRLRAFFFEGEISAQEAGIVFAMLISETKDLMPEEDTGVAVVRLFQSQLEDIIDFWGYLESPQYHIGAYGPTHRERYEFYLRERELIRGAEDLVQSVLGEQTETKTLEEIKKEIEAIILKNEGVYNIEILELKTPDQRNVDIRGVVSGYPFEAAYDRYQDSIRDVYVYGELISERPIKIEGLADILQSEFSDVAEEMGEDEIITMETIAQRVARKNITETLRNYGFILETENVNVIDEYNLVYRIEKIKLEGYEDIEITFDFIISGGEIVSNLLMEINGEPKVFNEYASIEELIDMIKIEDNLLKNPPPETSGILR